MRKPTKRDKKTFPMYRASQESAARIRSSYLPAGQELGELIQVLEMPGWKIIQKIGVAAQEEFWEIVRKLNPLAPDYLKQLEVSARRADVAQTLWEEFARRIELAASTFDNDKPKGTRPTPSEALSDITEGVL